MYRTDSFPIAGILELAQARRLHACILQLKKSQFLPKVLERLLWFVPQTSCQIPPPHEALSCGVNMADRPGRFDSFLHSL